MVSAERFRIKDSVTGSRVTRQASGRQKMRCLPVTIALAAWLLAGCASTPGDDDAGARRAPQRQVEQKEYPGVVESAREVEFDSARTGVGPLSGAVIGGSVGGSVGSGRGSTVGAVIGTVAGAVAGEAAEQGATRPGLEITVKLDDGRVIAVTQSANKESFKPGDRVRVVSDGRAARVTR
jgi:outer membrane lipoprotein SlyB